MSVDLEEIRMHQRHQIHQIFAPARRGEQCKERVLVVDPSLVGLLSIVLLGEDSRFAEEEEKKLPKPGAKKGAPEPPKGPATLEEAFKLKGVIGYFDAGPTEEAFEVPMKKPHVVYFVRYDPKMLNAIASHVLAHVEKEPKKRATVDVYLVPRLTLMAEHLLTERGVYSEHCSLFELDVDLVPYDTDVMSMELPHSFRDVALQGDASLIYNVAKALVKLQLHLGPAAVEGEARRWRVRGKGDAAAQVARVMHRMQIEVGDLFTGQKAGIECIYVFDRRSDLLTPLLTQRTYEGLIDELLGPIENRTLEPNFDIGDDGDGKVRLTNEDVVFRTLRDTNWRAAGPRVREKAQEIQAFEQSRKELTALKDIKNFMRELPKKQEQKKFLGIHMRICTEIKDLIKQDDFECQMDAEQLIVCGDPHQELAEGEKRRGEKEVEKEAMELVEDGMCRGDVRDKVLRLVCLFSLANGGLRPKLYEQWKAQLVQTFGVKVLPVVDNLEVAGLLRRQDEKRGNTFAQLREKLSLCLTGVNTVTPSDMAHTYVGTRPGHHGYAPALCRLVERAQQYGWGSAQVQPALGLMPGATYPTEDDGGGPAAGAAAARAVVVFFLGGVTYAEISALRFLGQQLRERAGDDPNPPQLIVATTGITNGNALIETVSFWKRQCALPRDFG